MSATENPTEVATEKTEEVISAKEKAAGDGKTETSPQKRPAEDDGEVKAKVQKVDGKATNGPESKNGDSRDGAGEEEEDDDEEEEVEGGGGGAAAFDEEGDEDEEGEGDDDEEEDDDDEEEDA